MKFSRIALFLFFTVFISSQAFAKEYIVKVKKNANFGKVLSTLHTNTVNLQKTHTSGRLAKISINTDKKKEAAQILAEIHNNKNIEYVVENIKLFAFESPTDEKYEEQWALKKVNALGAWTKTTGSHDIVVAVIDTGVDINHVDIKNNLWVNKGEIAGNNKDDDNNGFVDDIHGWDFHKNDSSPNDETSKTNPGHGTHCSGIIGAVGNNQIGISGISHKVSIMPIRFLGADGSGDLFSSTKAIDYAVANGAHIISASWGAPSTQAMAKPIIEAIDRAREKGVLFVVAAGNSGTDNDKAPNFPANAGLSNVIDVAASGPTDNQPKWTNTGKLTVDVASPGEDILSTLPGDKYGKLSGTSMATPLVAGLAALLKSQDPSLTPEQIKAVIQKSGSEIGIKTACKCRVDADKATSRVKKRTLTIVPAAGHIDINATLQFSGWGGQEPYQFSISDSKVATISEEGLLTAVEKGEVQVTLTDSLGESSATYNLFIGEKPSDSAACPFGNPMICQIMCMITPQAPWCPGNGDDGGNDDNKSGGGGGLPDLPPGFPGLPGA